MRSTIVLTLVIATVPGAVMAQAVPPASKSPSGAVVAAPTSLSFTTEVANEPRVELDLDNQNIRDALKQLFDRAKQSYKVDEDVPDTARITVRAKNVRLSTALELLLQDAGLGVVRQLEDGKLIYRIRKSGPDTLSTTEILRSLITSKANPLAATQHIEQFLRVHPGGRLPGQFDQKHLEGLLKVLPGAGGGNTLPYVLSVREQRSLFKCPHCKGQATVIRQQEQPKCEKCSRPFQAGWQFCPADGAKRPAPVGEWKYCPFCSKKVDGEKGAGVPFLEDLPFIGSLFRTEPAPVVTPRAPITVPTKPAPQGSAGLPGELGRAF